jgi:hypothetical protein
MTTPILQQMHKISVSLFALCLALTFASLFLYNKALYAEVLRYWGNPSAPFPFVDLHYVLSNVQCWKLGINVYVQNPCDVLHRTFDYSPLWLRATFLPAPEWTSMLGWALLLSFILSLCYLIRWHGVREFFLFTLATISPMVVYGVERANVDVIIFLCCLSVGMLLTRKLPQRLLGYLVILLVGLLKFYPLTLLILVIRERLLTCIAIVAVTLGSLILFYAEYRDELLEMALNLPSGSYFYDIFGAPDLPYGLKQVLPDFMQSYYNPNVLYGILISLSTIYSMYIFRQCQMRQYVAMLPPLPRIFLMIGAILVIGCFVFGQNNPYRGIYFLFVVTGLLALSRKAEGKANSLIFSVSSIIVIFLMWAEWPSRAIKVLGMLISSKIPDITFWLCYQLLWWWLIGLLGGLVMSYVWNNTSARAWN